MNDKTITKVHTALQQLAGVCDHAHQRDDQGFSANHAMLGHRLANQATLSPYDVQEGFHILKHYRRQLGDPLIDELALAMIQERLDQEDDVPVQPDQPDPLEELDASLTDSLNEVFPLTLEQEEAMQGILDWFNGPDRLDDRKQGGFAGTGKTTLIKVLRTELRCYSVITSFTGKACNVLQRKGLPAQTMHSLLYDVKEGKDGSIYFEKKSTLKDNPDLIIVDEASMVSQDLYNDAKSFGVPMLFVGDPGQLPPVGNNPNLMKDPHNVLQQIHRQAAQSPIIQFATDVRLGKITKPMPKEVPGLTIKNKVIRASEYFAADQIICAKNTTRRNTNTMLRVQKGLPPNTIVKDEKLICLRNDRRQGVFNGMILFVRDITADSGTYWECTLEDEVGTKYRRMKVWKEPFIRPMEKDQDVRVPYQHIWCDYGYVITCHKSQGSEWPSVLVLDEWMPAHIWDMKRWRYTAITRAAKNLVYCV